ISSGCNAQNGMTKEKEIVEMLKTFYESQGAIWSIPASEISTILFEQKLDSLAEMYSTPKLRKEATEWLDDGHDLFTNDWGIRSKDIGTIEIKRDMSKNDAYIVTYTTFLDNPGNNPQKKYVTLNVTVVMDGKSYKIDSVK
ncbi:MAG: hypothetical protein L0Y37_07795, partial [Bacteroidales bacterium]|nr:hypothetical protein [Bacteroidales bacterium]